MSDDKWIPVTDRLPEIDVPVWAAMPSGYAMLAVRSEVDEGWAWCNTYGNVTMYHDKWTADDSEFDDQYEPVAWHPLPTPYAAPTAQGVGE